MTPQTDDVVEAFAALVVMLLALSMGLWLGLTYLSEQSFLRLLAEL